MPRRARRFRAGKFIAGLLAASVIFGTSTASQLSLLAVNPDPAPPLVAISSLLLLSAIEINYGAD